MHSDILFDKVIRYGVNMFYKHTVDHKLTYVSPQCIEYLGCTPEEAKVSWTEFVTDHPINRKGFYLTQKAIDTGEVQQPFELQLKRTDGEIIWALVNEAPEIVNGKVVGVIGALTDITKQKKKEEILNKLSLIASKTSDIIILTDSENKTEWVNQAFVNKMGYERSESVGKLPWSLLSGKDTDEEVIRNIELAVQRKKTAQVVILTYSKKRDEIWMELSIDPLFNKNKRYIGYISVGKDITQRKNKERKLLKTLQENDTLVMEMHDRVKNNLALISAMLELHAMNEENQKVSKKIHDSILRIKSISNVHEQLYKNEELTSIEIEENTKSLISNIIDTIHPKKNIGLDLNLNSFALNIEQAIPLSLIINEVLTNSFKHAFGSAINGLITVNLSERNGLVKLTIRDNGIGFDDKSKNNEIKSTGFVLIDALSKQLSGEYVYKSTNTGVLFELDFKKSF